MSDDADLLRRYAVDGAQDAFAEFVRRHLGLVYGAAARRLGGDAHAAADVAQQVFVVAAREAGRLARHPEVAGWLFATARNVALDRMKAERRRRRRESAAQTEQAILAEVSAPADWEMVRPVIDGALEELEPADREAVLLRFFEGRSFAEVGRRLRLTENAARMRVGRALDKLQGLLTRRGVSSSAAALGLVLAQEAAAVPAGLGTAVTNAALASGAAGASGVAAATGIFAIMNTTKIVVGVAVVLGAAGLGTGVYQRGVAKRAQAEAEGLRATRERERAALTEAGERGRRDAEELNARAQRIAALEAEARMAAERSRAGAVTSGGGGAGAAASATNAGLERMANPDYARLATLKVKAEVGLRYAPLYRMLGLTPEQIARFEANRVAFEQTTMEVWSAAVAKGVSVNDPAMMKMASESAHGLDKELEEILGAAGRQEFIRYSAARSGMEFVGSLAGNLYHTSTPLTPAQGEALTRLVVENTRAVTHPTRANARHHVTDWTTLAEAARRTLIEPQLGVLNAMLHARELQQQMSAWTPPGAPPPTPGTSAMRPRG